MEVGGAVCQECEECAQSDWYYALLAGIAKKHDVCGRLLLAQESGCWIQQNAMELAGWAGAFGNTEFIRHLMDTRALILSVRPLSGLCGPLISAVRKGQEATARFLLQNGAPLDYGVPVEDGKTFTALDFALETRSRPIIHLLLDAGARTVFFELSRETDPHMWALFEQRRHTKNTARILYGVLRFRYHVSVSGFVGDRGYRLQRELAQQIARNVWHHRTDVKTPAEMSSLARRDKKKGR